MALLRIALFVLLAALPLQPQEEPEFRPEDDRYTLSVDVDLVTLDVGVLDSNGRPVLDLTREDFRVYEDGEPREIRNFFPVDAPYSVLALIDCSASTTPNQPFLIEAMRRFVAELRPQDNIALAQFGSRYKRLQKWTRREEMGPRVGIQPQDASCAGTDFYGGIKSALDQDLDDPKGRKGAVVLTDGLHEQIKVGSAGPQGLRRIVDAADDGDFRKLLDSVRKSDVVFYFVAVNSDMNPNPNASLNLTLLGARGLTDLLPAIPVLPAGGAVFVDRRGGVVVAAASSIAEDYGPDTIFNMQQIRSRLELLAAASGGRVVFPRASGDVVPLFQEIAHELGTSYGLGYAPIDKGDASDDGRQRKIEVRVTNPDYEVRQSRDRR